MQFIIIQKLLHCNICSFLIILLLDLHKSNLESSLFHFVFANCAPDQKLLTARQPLFPGVSIARIVDNINSAGKIRLGGIGKKPDWLSYSLEDGLVLCIPHSSMKMRLERHALAPY